MSSHVEWYHLGGGIKEIRVNCFLSGHYDDIAYYPCI